MTPVDMNETPSITSRIEFWLVIITFVLFLGGFYIAVNRVVVQGQATQLEPAPVKGHPAPEISLVSTTGQTLNLSDFQGKPVIVNFWATWCAPCRVETPELQDLHRERGDDVIIFSVNATAQDSGDIDGFIEEFGMTFPVVLDPDATAFKTYNVLGLPTTVFIDADGVIQEVFTGPVNRAYMESKLPELS
ncbi:MAG: redoxin family protein [Chloroflexota bacterium]